MTCAAVPFAEVKTANTNDANLMLAEELVALCRKHEIRVATAESLTGGMIGSCITSISGSSQIYSGGIISYTNEAKASLLNVSKPSLETYGAVSDVVACEMAQGALNALGSNYAISVTGIAGPTGEEPGKPVGTVYIAVASQEETSCIRYLFNGSRDDVRATTVNFALRNMLEAIKSALD